MIGAGARIGARTIVHPHVVIGDGAAIGPDCILHAHVSIRERCAIGARVIVQNGAVIGSDGYGFAQRADGTHEKIPQTAPVVIEDDVEIGANTTIDRPAVGETRIKAGTKIDNLVQIAHGVVLGRNVAAGGAGRHRRQHRGRRLRDVRRPGRCRRSPDDRRSASRRAAKTGITDSVDAGRASCPGYPAMDNERVAPRVTSVFRKLPEMRKQLRALEERLEDARGQ